MPRITTSHVRSVLNSNLTSVVVRAHNAYLRPNKISDTQWQGIEAEFIGRIQFAFEIDAINANAFVALRDDVLTLVSQVKDLRDAHEDRPTDCERDIEHLQNAIEALRHDIVKFLSAD